MATGGGVNVPVTIVAGANTLTPSLQQTRNEVEALRRALASLQAQGVAPPLQLQALGKELQQREAELNRATVRHQADVLSGAAGGGAGGGLGQRGLAVGLRAMQSGHLSAALMARSLSSVAAAAGGVAGPLGAIVTVAALAVTAVEALDQMFSRTRHTVAELHAEHEGLIASIRAGRTTGLPTEQGAALALTPAERAVLERNAQAGRGGAVREQLARIGSEAGAERARLEAEGGGALNQQYIEMVLQQQSDVARGAGGGGLNVPGISGLSRYSLRQDRLRLFRQMVPGINESDIPQDVLDNPVLTNEQIRQASALARRPTNLARSREEMARLARSNPAALLEMLPGAPRMPDTGFQSRQGEVLEAHDEIQRELIRDFREEQRFQAIAREFERANAFLAQLAGAPTPPPAVS